MAETKLRLFTQFDFPTTHITVFVFSCFPKPTAPCSEMWSRSYCLGDLTMQAFSLQHAVQEK